MIADVASFLHARGALHDVTIRLVSYRPDANVLVVEVKDLNWNDEGAPNYTARPSRLVFTGVSALSIALGQDRFHTSVTSEGAILSEASAITKSGVTRVDFLMSTSERWYVEFAALEIEDIA